MWKLISRTIEDAFIETLAVDKKEANRMRGHGHPQIGIRKKSGRICKTSPGGKEYKHCNSGEARRLAAQANRLEQVANKMASIAKAHESEVKQRIKEDIKGTIEAYEKQKDDDENLEIGNVEAFIENPKI